MNKAIISLGTNLGNKEQNLDDAITNIGDFAEVKKVSSYIKSEFWLPEGQGEELESQPEYLNAVLEISTNLDPQSLLTKLQEIELLMGRRRLFKWAPRIIDLDIITFNQEIINTEDLVIPHHLATQRDFVMEPIKEIDEEMYNWLKQL